MSSLSHSHQRVCRQRQNAEHQVAHHLGVPLDPEGMAAELILERSIAALGSGAFVVSDGFGRGEFDLLAPARVGVDQGNMAPSAARLAPLGAALGGVHQVVEVGH